MEDNNIAQNNLKAIRKLSKTTIYDIARECDFSHTTITFIENRKRAFREIHLVSLSSYLNVTMEYLAGRSDRGIKADYNGEEILLNIDEAKKLLSKGWMTCRELDTFNLKISVPAGNIRVNLPKKFIYRELDSKAIAIVGDIAKQQLKNKIDLLDAGQSQIVLNIVNEMLENKSDI